MKQNLAHFHLYNPLGLHCASIYTQSSCFLFPLGPNGLLTLQVCSRIQTLGIIFTIQHWNSFSSKRNHSFSLEEVGCPLRRKLPVVTPSAAPQEGQEQECTGRVNAPSGTIAGMDPQSLAGGGVV